MLPTAGISLLTMNVATSAAGATMENIIQNYPGNLSKCKFITIRSKIAYSKQQIYIMYPLFSRVDRGRTRNVTQYQEKENGTSS